MRSLRILGLVVFASLAACHPASRGSVPLGAGRVTLFQWGGGAGPCPPGSVCSADYRVDGAGVLTAHRGESTHTARVSSDDLARLNATLTGGSMLAWVAKNPECEAPVSDMSESFDVRVGDGPVAHVVMRMGKGHDCDPALFAKLEAEGARLQKLYVP